MGENDILPRKFSERFAPAMGLRNILVHKYGEIKTELLQEHLKEDSKDFETFSKSILDYLKNKEE